MGLAGAESFLVESLFSLFHLKLEELSPSMIGFFPYFNSWVILNMM